MVNKDIKEILDELRHWGSNNLPPDEFYNLVVWIQQKRSEYEEPKGDCCG